MLTHWTQKLTKLRTDKNPKRWSALTTHQAPHKPFLLLAIMDLMEAGRITENRFEPSLELVEAFSSYWDKLFSKTKISTMAYPFPRLQGDGVLTLIPLPEVSHPLPPTEIHSLHKLRSCYSHAQLDDCLYILLQGPKTREILRSALITHYFAPEIRPIIQGESRVNRLSATYTQYLLNRKTLTPNEVKEVTVTRIVRDRGFRGALLPEYDHRCALCKVRVQTPEEHHVVDAAHIIPFAETQNNDLTNGLSLCKLCHWAFDEGMLGIDKHHQIIVSHHLKSAGNSAAHLLGLENCPIVEPRDQTFSPGFDNLAWHRRRVFVR
ncbi:HNH endonuclease [Desulfoluna sp.]|uniref:HNH endonuclease n=1 Tax=Desulfoluna sp. TaxID=2045199 RepID=UPI00261C75D3|nr:HNH endonuclease [Desulfoluna sp.]